MPGIMKAMKKIAREGSAEEDRAEPHAHLFILLLLVIVLGSIIGLIGI
jgi:hypothetical protein